MRFWLAVVGALTLVGVVGGGFWISRALRGLDQQLVEKFAGRRWDFPSKIYSDSLVFYAGSNIGATHLVERLSLLNYRRVARAIANRGEFRHDPKQGILEIFPHDFRYPNRSAVGFPVRLRLRGDEVTAVERADTAEAVDSLEIEPEPVAGIYERVWEERRLVKLREMPAMLVRAVLAAEDQRFFEHHGIDLWGIGRAFVANFRSRRVVEGGSTLTQQLVKNFFLSEARTMKRKIIEATMAVLAERRFSKLEILETYLNEIYLGQRGPKGIFGIWEGSRFYFGKEPKDLTLGETATLAGLIKAPGRYSPTRNPERSLKRRNQVLRSLLKNREITRPEYDEALAEPLPDRLPTVESTAAPYFVDFVRNELLSYVPEDTLTSQGFSIFTSLDAALQRAAESAVTNGVAALEKLYPKFRRGNDRLEAALVALQPQTGEVRAMVGGRSYRESQFNRATQAFRQPGSVFKPIVFLAAFEEEERRQTRAFVPTRIIDDRPFTWFYDGREWSPANYKDEYRGPVSLRQVLELSLNSATARLAEEIGIEPIRDLAVRLGFPANLPALPSLVLGSVEVTPFQVAQAFSAIANLGFRTEAGSIRTVLDAEGKSLVRNPMRAEQVVSPRVAYLVTSLMQGVLDRGTATGARRAGFTAPAAGKTGTTNEGRDAWFVGFTPDLLTVVWVGFDREQPLGLSGGQAALPIWTEFMKAATANGSPTPFLVPPGIQLAAVDPMSGGLATPMCPTRFDEVFIEGDAPIEPCPFHPAPGMEAGSPQFAGSAVPVSSVPGPVPILVPTPTGPLQ